jgi:hypothetical protein
MTPDKPLLVHRRGGLGRHRPAHGPEAATGAGGAERSEPVRLGSVTTTHALFAMKVQRKLRNGVAGSSGAGSFLDRQNRGKFANLSDAMDLQNVRAEMPAEIAPAAHPRPRSSNANGLCWRILAEPTGVITRSQIHGSRTDS